MQRLNPSDSGVGWSVLSVAGVTQARWAHGGHELCPAARLGVESRGALPLGRVGVVASTRRSGSL